MKYLIFILLFFAVPDTARKDTVPEPMVKQMQEVQEDMDSLKIQLKDMLKKIKADTLKIR